MTFSARVVLPALTLLVALLGAQPTSAAPDVAKPKPSKPVVTKVKPASGPVAGGTKVAIKGAALSGATNVLFGTTKGSKVTVKSDKKLKVDAQLSTEEPVVTVVPATASAAQFPRAYLQDVACLTDGACVAVGYFNTSDQGTRGLAVSGHGSTWVSTELPLPADADVPSGVRLPAIACHGASLCMAVGTYLVRGRPMPLVLTWDGASWRARASRLPANARGRQTGDLLGALSCGGPQTCVAVGNYQTKDERVLPMMVRLASGRLRTVAGRALEGQRSAEVWSVSCPAADACVVAGTSEGAAAPGEPARQLPMVVTTRKASWHPSSPRLPAGTAGVGGFLWDVSCADKGRCTAVGNLFRKASPGIQGLVAVLHNGRWATAAVTGHEKTKSMTLNGFPVVCPRALACRALGWNRGAALVRLQGPRSSTEPIAPAGESDRGVALACRTSSTCLGVGSTVVSRRTKPLLVRVGPDGSVGEPLSIPERRSGYLVAVAVAADGTFVAVGTIEGDGEPTEGVVVTVGPTS